MERFLFLKGFALMLSLSVMTGTVSATVLTGFATNNGSTVQVGLSSGDNIFYYIPIESGPDVTYGVDGGTTVDTVDLGGPGGPGIDGATLHMYLYFNIPDGEQGASLSLRFVDLDLSPDNDPAGFFEALTLFGQGGLPNERFTDFADINDLTNATVSSNDPGTNNDISIDFTGLNIASGDFWLHLAFDAFSTFNSGKWQNTKEKIFAATLTTTEVPEPGSLILMGLGLLSLFRLRRMHLQTHPGMERR